MISQPEYSYYLGSFDNLFKSIEISCCDDATGKIYILIKNFTDEINTKAILGYGDGKGGFYLEESVIEDESVIIFLKQKLIEFEAVLKKRGNSISFRLLPSEF